jgi:VWFA-related protein
VPQDQPYTFRVNSDLVQLSVVVRDRSGKPVRGLTREDFEVAEDGQRQQIAAVDLEIAGEPRNAPGAAAAGLPPALNLPLLTTTAPPLANSASGLRLVVLTFDFTSLEPDDAARALRAAESYVGGLGPADRVAIVGFTARLNVEQDFSGDAQLLRAALQRMHGLSTIVSAGSSDSAYGDRDGGRLRQLQALAAALRKVRQKKAVVLFAGRAASDRDPNSIVATLDAALTANVSFYGIDASGLSATPPMGSAGSAADAGIGALSGVAVVRGGGNSRPQLLYTLAQGTGGRAFFGTNDLGKVFRALESDTREYYLLSYRSTNLRRDGEFRRVEVRLRWPAMTVKAPAGYYAPREMPVASPGAGANR